MRPVPSQTPWQKESQLISMQLMIYPACCQRQHCLKTQQRMRENRQALEQAKEANHWEHMHNRAPLD